MSNPDSVEYIEIARRFADRVAERTDEIDEGRRVPEDLVGEMMDANLFRLLIPKSLGGIELDHPSFLEIVRIFSNADASTAWCVNQNNIFATDSARMPEETARKIWGPQRGNVTNGPPSRGNLAVPVEGGYQLTGHWDFSSGSSHSTWQAAISPVEGVTGELRTFVVPKSDATMLDTWQVNGLRGTASFSFDIDDVFVPADHSYLESDSPTPNIPIMIMRKASLFPIGFATISIALARACLDDVIKLAGRKTARGISGVMADQSTVQRQIGENEATLRAADAFLRNSTASMWDTACGGGEINAEQQVEVRISSTYAIRQSALVVSDAYEMFGSDAVFVRNPIQRRYQDMHVVAQQFQGRASHYETAARHYLGKDTAGYM
jgi:alkylation response protein AidB-like acyl-CoA dehydrogenase